MERIAYSKAGLSSFGTMKFFLNSGFLTNKPIEYESQSRDLLFIGLHDPIKGKTGIPDGLYILITKNILSLLDPIKSYIAAIKR